MYSMTFVSFLLMLININCSQSSYDNKELCYKFYQINKSSTFEGLYDLDIGGSFISEYDEAANQNSLSFNYIGAYNPNTSQYVSIPVFKKGATNSVKKSVFEKSNFVTKQFLSIKLKTGSQLDLFDLYVNYVDNILTKYCSIKTPPFHNNKSVSINGNPSLGKFITFELNDKTKCFYLKDRSGLTPYWDKFFNDSRKFDDRWYYEIK